MLRCLNNSLPAVSTNNANVPSKQTWEKFYAITMKKYPKYMFEKPASLLPHVTYRVHWHAVVRVLHSSGIMMFGWLSVL